MSPMLYQAVQIIYWLVLSIWLGSMVFLAIGAPVIFRVARRMEVVLPRYSSDNLTDQQGTILGGEIVGALLARLAQVQMVCATVMLPMMIAQWLMIDLTASNLTVAMIRFALWLVAVVLLAYEWRGHYPRTWRLRQEYLSHADEPEVADPIKEQFDREHRKSEQIFQVTVFLLIGLVMFSANISPRVRGSRGGAVPVPVETTK
jgi:hypothetical protein